MVYVKKDFAPTSCIDMEMYLRILEIFPNNWQVWSLPNKEAASLQRQLTRARDQFDLEIYSTRRGRDNRLVMAINHTGEEM